MSRPFLDRALLAAYAALILALSLEPMSEDAATSLDKLHHFLAYFVMAWLLLRALPRGAPVGAATVALATVAVFAFGGVVELLQGGLTESRHADILDALANGAGALVGALSYRFWSSRQGVRACS